MFTDCAVRSVPSQLRTGKNALHALTERILHGRDPRKVVRLSVGSDGYAVCTPCPPGAAKAGVIFPRDGYWREAPKLGDEIFPCLNADACKGIDKEHEVAQKVTKDAFALDAQMVTPNMDLTPV